MSDLGRCWGVAVKRRAFLRSMISSYPLLDVGDGDVLAGRKRGHDLIVAGDAQLL